MDNAARRICDALDIKEVMQDYGIEFNRNGFCRCFIRSERTPSMSIKNNHYKCFGCGAYGGVIDFVMEHEGLDFRGAMVALNSRYGLGILGGNRRPTRRDRLRAREERQMRELEYEGHERYDKAYETLTDLFRIASKTALVLKDEDLEGYAKEMEEILDMHSEMEAYRWMN